MRIALAQMSSGTDPVENLRTMDDYVEQAAEADASLVVFPEAGSRRGAGRRARRRAEHLL